MFYFPAYHKFEIRGRLRLIGIGKKDSKVTPLTEENAAELGADILGELIIYTVASLTIFLEYYRQSKQKAEHEETQEDRLDELRKHVLELEAAGDRQRAEISSLTREIHEKLDKMSEELKRVKEKSPAKGPAKVAGLDSRALVLFFGMFSGALIFIMNTS